MPPAGGGGAGVPAGGTSVGVGVGGGGDPLRKKRVEAGEAAHHRRRLKYLNDVEAEFAAALR